MANEIRLPLEEDKSQEIKEKMEKAHRLYSVAFILCLFMLIYLIGIIYFNPYSYPEEMIPLFLGPVFLDITSMFYLLFLLKTKEKRVKLFIALHKDTSEMESHLLKLKRFWFKLIPISIFIIILGFGLYFRYNSDYFVFIFIVGIGLLGGSFFGIYDAKKNLKKVD